jgi:glycosyltransferase involved in cell wall biosynthesis
MLTFLQRPAERWLFSMMIGAPDFKGMTVNCDALRQSVLREFPQLANRIMVAHNGADPLPEDLEPANLGETGGRLQVGYVGHLYPGKGFELIRKIAALTPWADFHVVGGEQDTVEALRRDSKLSSNIRIHGFVAPSEVERLSLAFDVLLAPYQSEVQVAGGGETSAWMSPLKLFSYMATGRPIMCSDLPVLREVIEHGQNGLLLPPDNPHTWVAGLRSLIANPAEGKRLGTNAQRDFLVKHTWQGRASRVLTLLQPGYRDGWIN